MVDGDCQFIRNSAQEGQIIRIEDASVREVTLRLKTMLVLTSSAAAVVIASHWRAGNSTAPSWRAVEWLRSFGRLSYEIYLTHMFVVWAAVDAFDSAGANARMSFAWYLPVLASAWALGWLVARVVSQPLERRLLRSREGASRASPSAHAAEARA